MGFLRKNITWVTTPALIILFIAVWHFYVVWFEVSKFILPTPGSVLDGLVELFETPSTYKHTWITVYETISGFAIASVIGIGLGAVLGKVRWLEKALNPFIIATQVVPKVALIPLFILWFGFGPESKIIISAVIAFFPILTNTVLGVKSVDFGHKDIMISLNASKWQTFSVLFENLKARIFAFATQKDLQDRKELQKYDFKKLKALTFAPNYSTKKVRQMD